jgi:hypothetical protein
VPKPPKPPFDPEWWSSRAVHAPDGRLCYESFHFSRHSPKGGLGRHAEYFVVHDDLLPVGSVYLLFGLEPRWFGATPAGAPS